MINKNNGQVKKKLYGHSLVIKFAQSFGLYPLARLAGKGPGSGVNKSELLAMPISGDGLRIPVSGCCVKSRDREMP
jgi:hypothetical protein